MKHLIKVQSIIILAYCLIIGCSNHSYQIEADQVEPDGIEISTVVRNLSDAVQFKTISYSDTSETESAAFIALNEFIKSIYPEIHSSLNREVINEYSLLYTWSGSNTDLNPVVLLAHTDVVPADTSNTSPWETNPFSGLVDDETIWGRGTLDDKLSVFGILEAVEYLLKDGYQPERSVIMAFGHDEEIGGKKGAALISAELSKRNIHPDFILDEGGVIVEEGVPGITLPVALVGIAEKGYLSLKLLVKSTGGHSSMPPKNTAISMISQAIVDLKEYPMPSALEGPVREMLITLAPESSFPFNFLFSNLWAFGGIIESQLAAAPKSDALIRTTTAPTIINAGVKDNILPSKAEAIVNFRLKPGDSVEDVINHVKNVIDNPDITVSILGNSTQPASNISNYKTNQFKALAKSIRQTFPDVLVSPYISVGGTDAKHYENLSNQIYRFLPIQVSSKRLESLHGVDERITKSEYKQVIKFYIQIISNSTGPGRLW